MPDVLDTAGASRRRTHRRGRLRPMAFLRSLLALVLTIQLLAALDHHHPLDQSSSDCPACVLSMHWSGGVSPASVPLPAPSPAVPFTAARTPVTPVRAAPAHIRPFSQAPPAAV